MANKVGGIYTVLVSKMSYALENVKNYFAIGPYYQKSASSEFKEESPPENLAKVFSELERKYGIVCHYGRWLIEKSPRAILVDPARFREKINEVKGSMWQDFGIDSWGTDDWYNEPVMWSKCTGLLIQEIAESGAFGNRVVAHFHEWLSGAGLLHLKSQKIKIPTVFTTHSTVLGRAIAESGQENLNEMINRGLESGQVVGNDKVYQYYTQAKHLTEKATALNATVFTTVSDIMARECRFILGRKPDVVLPNGLDMNKFPAPNELARMHITNGDRIRNFLLGYFLPYYDVDFDDSIICFISGRFEFHNKGVDIFIDALGELNEKLKKAKQKKNVVAFIFIPAETHGKKPTVVEHLELFAKVEKAIEDETGKIEKRVLKSFIKGELPRDMGAFDSEFLQSLKALGERLKSMAGKLPPVTPFVLHGENSITKALADNGLMNRAQDRVKIIYYPAYLSEKDGMLAMNYYSAVSGFDVGVFPSYYESWGYTPLEAAALGLHSVTTDLSGYGQFIRKHLKNGEMSIMVLHRDKKDDSDAARELEKLLYRIYCMSSEERAKSVGRAKELSMLADWSHLFENYIKAYGMAVSVK